MDFSFEQIGGKPSQLNYSVVRWIDIELLHVVVWYVVMATMEIIKAYTLWHLVDLVVFESFEVGG